MIAAMRIAVPLADSQLKVNTAGSAVARTTTGGTRWIILSKPGIASFGAEMASSFALTLGRPQRKTMTLSKTHGSQGEGCLAVVTAGGFVGVASSLPPRHTRRNAVRQTIDVTAAMMSTSHGPWKFETRNCGTANATPATSSAGQISSVRRKPA